jgi:two-component sensor histidine kinase
MEDSTYTLTISDNGIGMPADVDWRNTSTLGLRLVKMLCEHQLGGRLECDCKNGTHFRCVFDAGKKAMKK